MALHIDRVRVKDFRSFSEMVLEPDPELTVVAGPNATGKTNLIEAVQVLTEAQSFRRPLWGDLVRQGSDEATAVLEASGDERRLCVEMRVTAHGRRTYKVNGKTRRSVSGVAGIIPCVVFTPDDLRLVKDSAEKRRAALDSLGAQLSPTYAQLKTEYDRVLRHRNALLKTGAPTSQLDPWTALLIARGASLTAHRVRLFERVADSLSAVYARLTEGGEATARYLPSWERSGVEGEGDPEEMITRHLETHAEEELARKTTVAGPHRDDVCLVAEGREARAFASQGQQRTLALAWKLAEVEVVSEIATQRPILLLDDVMSELDELRRHALTSYAGTVAQTIMTTANLGYFEESLLSRAKVVLLQ